MWHRENVLGVGAALVTAALGAAVALGACAGAKPAQRGAAPQVQAVHPEVETGLVTCAECHAQATPEVAAQWQASRHGLALVKCFVCHGSTGADFRARPQAAGCAGCHTAQAATVSKDGAPARCFDCHAPHALTAKGTSPHPAPNRS